jgi:pimeloyl-ACP methyl ester carboxylesterase
MGSMRSTTVHLDGPVHVVDHGGEGTPIVLVHGLGGSHVNWIDVAPELTRYGHVRAVDLIGFGRTPPAGRSSEVLPNRDMVLRYLAQQCDSPAVLIGNSMGGFISLLVASKAPELLRAVITVGAALPREVAMPQNPAVTARFGLYMIPGLAERVLAHRYEKLGPEGVFDEIMDLCVEDTSRLSERAEQAHLEMTRERFEMPWVHEAFLSAVRSLVPLLLRRGKVEEIIQRIDVPGLIIQGEHDRLVPLSSAANLARWRPDWTFEVIEDCGHVPQLEKPERFLQFVGGWLEGLEAGEAARQRDAS